MNYLTILPVALCMLFPLTQPVLALDACPLEPVTVTAKKVEKKARDVSMSLTVIDNEVMENARIREMKDLGNFVPNFSMRQYGSDKLRQITIRGVGAQSRNIGFDTRVGAYLDGVYLGQSPALNYSIFDMERIEVLRGPQSTLYGKNTTAGAVHLISKKPMEGFENNVLLETGNYEHYLARAIVNAPVLEDKCYTRLSANYTDREGVYTNVRNGQDFDGENTRAFRAQLRTIFSDTAEFIANIDGVFSKKRCTLGDALTDTFARTANTEAPGDYDLSYNLTPTDKKDQYGISGTLEYNMGRNLSLISISAFRSTRLFFRNDTDYSANDFIKVEFDDKYHQYSQELRFHSEWGPNMEYLLGLYYERQEAQTRRTAIFGNDVNILGDPRLLPDNDIPNYGKVTTNAYSFFFNGDYRLTDKLSIEAGIRYSYETKDADYHLDGAESGFLNMATWQFRDRYSDSSITPNTGITYAFTDNITGYALVSTGIKSGGFNLDWLTENDIASGVEYDKETVVNYEAGVKVELFDHRMKADLSLFYAQYDDYQVQQFLDLGGGATAISITNAAEVTSKGVEFQLSASLLPYCRLDIGISLLDATFGHFPNAGPGGSDASGNDLPFAPSYTTNIGLEYVPPIRLFTGELTIRADYFHTDDYFSQVSNLASQPLAEGGSVPFCHIDGYHLISGKIALSSGKNGWSVFLWAKNLTNQKYLTDSHRDFFGTIIGVRGMPRTYGIGVVFRL